MLKYPDMRQELLDALRQLADINLQRKLWVNRDYDVDKFVYGFDEIVGLLYDDLGVDKNPSQAIGVFLLNENEAGLIQAVTQAIDRVRLDVGTEAADEEYIRSRAWPEVMKAASLAIDGLTRNDEQT
jgi:hypothetical protein